MGTLLFWGVVIGFFIISALTKKDDGEEDVKKAAWNEFFGGLNEIEKPVKPLKPQQRSSTKSRKSGSSQWKSSSQPWENIPRQETFEIPKVVTQNSSPNLSQFQFDSSDSSPVVARTVSAIADLVPIWEAAGRGKYEIVQQKIASGANVNEPDTFFGETALHRAAKVGDLEMVKLLLESGANVYAVDQYEETPLHFAIRGRNPEVVRLLLEYGANPGSEDLFGRTPIQCARYYADLRECFAL